MLQRVVKSISSDVGYRQFGLLFLIINSLNGNAALNVLFGYGPKYIFRQSFWNKRNILMWFDLTILYILLLIKTSIYLSFGIN